jgi:hypothetical protein
MFVHIISGSNEHILSEAFISSYKLGDDLYDFKPMEISRPRQIEKLGSGRLNI